MEALNPSPLTGYLVAIETLNGSNFFDWKLKIEITLSILDLDLALREDEPLKPNNESTTEYKGKTISSAIPDKENAESFMVHEQFVGPTKALAITFMTKLLTLRYDDNSSIRDLIMQMIDITNKLKSLYMEISDGLLYDKFKLTSNNGKKERNCNFFRKKGYLKRNYLKYKKWLENKGIQQQSESH
ncbi:hypothetical protein AMTRI_Chr05g72960 [Amborella trichopoda]